MLTNVIKKGPMDMAKSTILSRCGDYGYDLLENLYSY